MDSNENSHLEPISEEEFIQNRPVKGFFGLLPLIVLGVLVLLWLGGFWVSTVVSEKVSESPFHTVTNREFSLFLWQNPQFMRVHAKKKSGYLPAFEYLDRVGLDPVHADEFVVAPPEVLFLYHTWDRLLRSSFTPRPIPSADFQEFLTQVKEWQPEHWREAPSTYVDVVESLEVLSNVDLKNRLPVDVQRAFQGWMNYFKEGSAINTIQPTYNQMAQFLERYPNYARPFWRNIVLNSLPDYLKMDVVGDEVIPKKELSEFLKVGFYNFEASTKPSS